MSSLSQAEIKEAYEIFNKLNLGVQDYNISQTTYSVRTLSSQSYLYSETHSKVLLYWIYFKIVMLYEPPDGSMCNIQENLRKIEHSRNYHLLYELTKDFTSSSTLFIPETPEEAVLFKQIIYQRYKSKILRISDVTETKKEDLAT